MRKLDVFSKIKSWPLVGEQFGEPRNKRHEGKIPVYFSIGLFGFGKPASCWPSRGLVR